MKKVFPECPFKPMFLSELNRNDEYFMALAYNEALKAWKAGEVPVGAAIACGGVLLASAHNMVEQTNDATAHAEILAIGKATAKLGDWRLNDCVLYVTKEPCPMCSGACIMSRVGKVVFALPDAKMGFLGGAININEVKTLNHTLQIESGVLIDECSALIKTYFSLKREMEKQGGKQLPELPQ